MISKHISLKENHICDMIEVSEQSLFVYLIIFPYVSIK